MGSLYQPPLHLLEAELLEIERDSLSTLDVALLVGLHLQLVGEADLEFPLCAKETLHDTFCARLLVNDLQAIEQREVGISLEHVLANDERLVLLVEAVQDACLRLHLDNPEGLQVLRVHGAQDAAKKGHSAVWAVDVEVQLRADDQAANGAGHRPLQHQHSVGQGFFDRWQARHLAALREPAEQVYHAVTVLERYHPSAVDRGAQGDVVLHGEPSTGRIKPQLSDLALALAVQRVHKSPRNDVL
mmetsp:Transcript_56573/g.127656  ORF Transcript_56573/g.127656 Transcript_56573/m.127656 type:complete len:244 (-) Transcript_56573:1367-2098(-)